MQLRTTVLVVLGAAFMATAAQAYVAGGTYPPTGVPDNGAGNSTFVTLPDEPEQKAMTEEECKATGEDCPPGFDWYVRAGYELSKGLKLDIRYVDDESNETVAEGQADTWYDGNIGHYDTVKYVSPTIAGFTTSANWGEDDYWDVALRYAGEFGAIRVASGVGYDTYRDGLDPQVNVDNGSTYYGNGDAYYGTSKGFAGLQHVPTGLYIPGGYGETGQQDKPSSTAEGGNFSGFDGVGLRWKLKYDITPDGWYGRQLGLDSTYSAETYVAPVVERPAFEIGLSGKLNTFDLFKYGYLKPIDGFQVPEEDGGGFIGTFVPSEPQQSWGGLNIIGRYRPIDDFSIRANYTLHDTATGESQQLSPDDQSTYLDGFELGGPLIKDKLWFFGAAHCPEEFEGGGKAKGQAHLRPHAPSAEAFVGNPDGLRGFWNPKYDGALPVVVKTSGGRAALAAALQQFLNAPYFWFAPSDAALALGADSAAGQGGPAIEVEPGPEVVTGDDKCNRSKTIIGGPTGPAIVKDGGGGPATTARTPDAPCNCDKEQADYDKAKKALDKAEADLKAATERHDKAKAAYKAIDESLTYKSGGMGSLVATKKDIDALQAQNDKAVKEVDDAYAAKSKAQKARDNAKKAYDGAKSALDGCKAKCPSSGGGTAVPAGPLGPATTTGDKEKPCDCAKEQAAYDAAKKAEDAAQARLRDLYQDEKAAKAATSKALAEYEKLKGTNRAAEKTAFEDYNRKVGDETAAAGKATTASKAYEQARIATIRAKRALDECKSKCPGWSPKTGAGTAARAGPQGPATTTGEKAKPCDCAKEEAAYDAALKARDAAIAAEKRAKAAHEFSKTEYNRYSGEARIAPADQAAYDKALKATDAAYTRLKAAQQAVKDAKAAVERTGAALKACRTKCGQSSSAAPAGPSGTGTATNGQKNPCNCSKQQAAYDKALADERKAKAAADKALADWNYRAGLVDTAADELDEKATKAGSKYGDTATELKAKEKAKRGESRAQKDKDMLNEQVRKAREASKDADADLKDAQAAVAKAKVALDDCKRACP